MSKTRWILFLVCGTAFMALAAPAPQDSGYHLLKKVTLGGEGGWDYLTADPARTAFSFRGARILWSWIPMAKSSEIYLTSKVRTAPAVVTDVGQGFSSNGRSNSVTIFDLKTLATIREVKLPAADGPDGYLYDSGSKRVFNLQRSQ